MIKEEYKTKKETLLELVKDKLANVYLTEREETSLNKLLEIMKRYEYENRIEIKGLISRVIVDSLEIDYSIGEKFIEFDNSIS